MRFAPMLETLESRRLFHGSGVMVTDNFVMTSTDTVPRFAAHADFVAVQSGNWSNPEVWNQHKIPGAGAKVQIPHGIDVDYDLLSQARLDAVEVSGQLDFATQVDTSLWVNEIMVMPHGVLTIGTAAAPVADNARAEIVFTDTPGSSGLSYSTGTVAAPGIDPSQFGHGLLVFGSVVIHGRPLSETFVRVDGDAHAGDQTIALQQATQWHVGDSIVIPDTRHINPVDSPKYYTYVPQYETRVVTSIDGNRVTLDQPLTFDHLGPHDADGSRTVDFEGNTLAPHVGDLTRNVVLRSENPNGVRGHTAYFATASVDIRYAAFEDLGRTEAAPLDNTTKDAQGNVTHIGTNQIGRYSQHLHHLQGPMGGIKLDEDGPSYQWILVGNVINGGLKWGTAIHGASFGLLKDNVYYDIDGAAVAGESGDEYDNLIEHNFVVRINGGTDTFNGLGEALVDRGDQGDGFWFTGPMNVVRDNVVANARRNGYVVWPDNVPFSNGSHRYRNVEVPLFPGADMSMEGNSRTVNLLEEPLDDFVGNEAYGATTGAVQVWRVGNRTLFPDSPGVNTLTNTVVWHVTGVGIRFYYADSYRLDGWIQRGDPSMILRGTRDGGPSYPSQGEALTHAGSVAATSTVTRADVQNMTYGYINRGRGASDRIEIIDSFFDNYYNVVSKTFSQDPADGSRDFLLKNVKFGDAVNPGASNKIDMLWAPPTSKEATTPETFVIEDFDGIAGLDLQLYYLEQAPGACPAKVPDGQLPLGTIAPTRQFDNDSGQAAALRAKALGIDGLAFITAAPSAPQLFANVATEGGKLTLFYTVLGNTSGIAKVRFEIDGQAINAPALSGSIDLSFLPPSGRHSIDGSLVDPEGRSLGGMSRQLALPIASPPAVSSSNHTPVLESVADRKVVANQMLTFTLHAVDTDGDDLMYEADVLPPGAVLDALTGEFQWRPSNADAGKRTINFSVRDEQGRKSSTRVNIEVGFDASLGPVVGFWPLGKATADRSVVDLSGYGNSGTIQGTPSQSSGAMLFATKYDAVRINQSAAFMPTSSLTVSVSATPQGRKNDSARLVGFDSGSIPAYELSVKDGGSMFDARGLLQGYWFTVYTETGVHSVSYRRSTWTGTTADVVTGVFDGQQQGGKMSIYVNGQLKDELTGIGTRIVYPSFGGQQVVFGATADGRRAFQGLLADVKISTAASPII